VKFATGAPLIFSLLLVPSLGSAATCENLFRAEPSKARNVTQDADDALVMSREIERFFSGKSVVSILGSSRIADPAILSLTQDIAQALGLRGHDVMTGGGPGIMDAANRGARRVGAGSIGLELVSPWARHPTDYIDQLFVFRDLQARKSVFMKFSRAWVVMPGGLGSLDEVFSIIGAIYSGQTPKRPVILVGSAFWSPLLQYIQGTLVTTYGTAKPTDLDFVHVVETPEQVLKLIP